jgi:hypothetical protein
MKSAEYEENLNIASIMANNGITDIKLLPQIHASEVELRNRYFGIAYNKQYPTANPDAMIGNQPVEFKLANKNTFTKRLRQAAAKSTIAIVKLTEALTSDYIQRIIKGVWTDAELKNLNQIIIIHNEEMQLYKRP